MGSLFTLKDKKHNFRLLAFQFHTLDYSLGVLKNKRKELRSNPLLKHKIDSYLWLMRLYLNQELNGCSLPFDALKKSEEYLKDPKNKDLYDYWNLCKHITARELDMAELCKKVDFNRHLFRLEGNNLFCINSSLSTLGDEYTDIERDFLCSCARRDKRIIRTSSGAIKKPIFNENENNSLMRVI